MCGIMHTVILSDLLCLTCVPHTTQLAWLRTLQLYLEVEMLLALHKPHDNPSFLPTLNEVIPKAPVCHTLQVPWGSLCWI
jgi:hypothetical protein